MANETQISRVTRIKAYAKASYDRMSCGYAFFICFESAYCNASLRMLDVKRGEHFLKIRFGTGHSIVALA